MFAGDLAQGLVVVGLSSQWLPPRTLPGLIYGGSRSIPLCLNPLEQNTRCRRASTHKTTPVLSPFASYCQYFADVCPWILLTILSQAHLAKAMPSNMKREEAMLNRHLHERHCVCEEQLPRIKPARPRGNADDTAEGLDKYMEAVTDRELLRRARREQKSMTACQCAQYFAYLLHRSGCWPRRSLGCGDGRYATVKMGDNHQGQRSRHVSW